MLSILSIFSELKKVLCESNVIRIYDLLMRPKVDLEFDEPGFIFCELPFSIITCVPFLCVWGEVFFLMEM